MRNQMLSLFTLFLLLSAHVPHLFANTHLTNIFQYIGQPQNLVTHLLYLGGYRLYSPTNQVFLKQDSDSAFQNTRKFNSFNYSAGNPIMYQDPSGHGFISTFTNWGKKIRKLLLGETRVLPMEEDGLIAFATLGIDIVESENLPISELSNQVDPATRLALHDEPDNPHLQARQQFHPGEEILWHEDPDTGEIHAMRNTVTTKYQLAKNQGRCLVCQQNPPRYQLSTILNKPKPRVAFFERVVTRDNPLD